MRLSGLLRAGESMALMPSDRQSSLPLTAVIGVMCYLAALTLAAALAVSGAARDWTAGLAGSATVQLLGVDSASPDGQADRALDILRATPGIASAALLSRAESEALLEPWLGASEALSGLPMPQLIAVVFSPGAAPDVEALAARLKAEVPGASLDTHVTWRARLAGFAGALTALAYVVLVLIALAGAAAVIFATRAGLLAHSEVVEVLHLVGARDDFIAREFQHRFLLIGLEAGLLGAGLAAVTLFLGQSALGAAVITGGADYLPRLVPGLAGYLWLLAIPLAAALIAMLTARLTVVGTLRRML